MSENNSEQMMMKLFQPVNANTSELVMDFIIEEEPESLHLINAISLAFTCSWALTDELLKRL